MKKHVRCSSLPAMFSCSESILNTDKLTQIRIENGAENLGTDIHALIQSAIETGNVDFSKVERSYEAADVARARSLVAEGLRVVDDAKREMKNPQFEQEVQFETTKYLVTGHVDILDIQATRAYVVDFKSGRTRDDHYHQLAGYAVGAWHKAGRPADYRVTVVWVYLETGESPEPITFTAGDLQDWITSLDAIEPRYTVNRRCVYCPLASECKMFQAYLKDGVKLLTSETIKGGNTLRTMPRETFAKLATALKAMELTTKRVRGMIREEVLENGELPIGNGTKYIIRQRKERSLITNRALPVIAKYTSARNINDATRLNMSQLLQSAVSRVRGPMQAVLRKKIEDELEAKGAVTEYTRPYLETDLEKKVWPKKSPKKSNKKSLRNRHSRT